MANYENDPKLRAQTNVASLIKFTGPFGAAIYEQVAGHRTRVKQKRIEDFLYSFVETLENLSSKEVNVEKILTDDFGDILEEVAIQVSKNRSIKKRTAFKNILLNQFFSEIGFNEAEIFISIIAELQEMQINILQVHYENMALAKSIDENIINAEKKLKDQKKSLITERKAAQDGKDNKLAYNMRDEATAQLELQNAKKEMENLYYRHSSYYSLSDDQYSYFLNDLISKGLVIDHLDPEQYKKISITTFGKKLLEHILTEPSNISIQSNG